MEQTTTTTQPVAARGDVQPQQPAQTTQPWEPPKPEPYKPNHVFSVAKLILGGLNLIFAIITLGIGISFLVEPARYMSYLGIFILVVVAGISFVWQTAELLTRLLRRRTHRPLHPGAHVAVHLCLWILFAICLLSLSFGLAYSLADYTVGSSSSDQDCSDYAPEYQYLCDDDGYYDYYDGDRFATQGDAARYFAKLEALTGFAALMTLAHFVLFVMACIETDRRRKYGKRTKVVYLVAAPGPVDGKVYYTPVLAPQAALLTSRGMGGTMTTTGGGSGGVDPNLHGFYTPPGGGGGATGDTAPVSTKVESSS